MCSGRVDMKFVLRAFSKGIDGVFIGGCHFNECNYIANGNYHALNMTLLTKRIMEYIGLNPERLAMRVMSGSEANLYADHVNNFIKKIKELGPLGKIEGLDKEELNARLAKVTKLVPYIKVMKNDKLGTFLMNEDEYESLFTKDEINQLFNEMVSYYIDPEKCQACMTCARRCPEGAIISAKKEIHIIDQDKCIRCGSCMAGCPPRFSAIRKIVGEPVPPPVPEGERTVVRKSKEKAN